MDDVSYEEIEKAENEISEAKRKLEEAKINYLASRGWHPEFDFDSGTITWSMNKMPEPDCDGYRRPFEINKTRDVALEIERSWMVNGKGRYLRRLGKQEIMDTTP